MELEELQDELNEILVQLTVDQLKEVCTQAKVPIENQARKHVLIRLINKTADRIIENEEEEVSNAFLKRLIANANSIEGGSACPSQVVDDAAGDASVLASLQEQYTALQLSFQTSTKNIEHELK